MTSIPSYEYRTVELDTSTLGMGGTTAPVDRLNELGSEGWSVAAPITNAAGETVSLLMQREV